MNRGVLFGIIVMLKYNLKGLNTWHADTGELANAVQASGIIQARH